MSMNNATQSVGDMLRARAEEYPNKVFWWIGDDRATFAEANERSERVAAGLGKLGVQKGDRVAILSSNRGEYPEIIFALAKLGAIQVPLNAYLKGDFLQYQIEQSGAKIALADSAGVKALKEIIDRAPTLKKIIILDATDNISGDVEIVPFDSVRNSAGQPPRTSVAPSDLISIMYTSGTTGMPKGCMLSHGYYLHIGSHRRELLESGPNDVLFTPLPLFHGAGQMVVLMSALYEAITAVIEPQFSASSAIDRWIATGATLFVGVGVMGMAILDQPPSKKDRAHCVRQGLAIPFPPDLQEKFDDRFGVEMNSALYGHTECWPISASLPGQGKTGSQGKPISLYEVAIVDDDDNPLPSGETGEIVVRPKEPNSMYNGYWNQPEATINAWRNLWHHTGDAGMLDADGYLYFVDRKKDALRRRGENISSIELELAIRKHPKIEEAAVYAIPSGTNEDEVMVCLVIAAGETLAPEDLFGFLKTSLPYFAVPRYVRIAEEMPKTAATMRVQKHLLREEGVTPDTWDFEAMGLRVDRTERR